MIVKYFAFSSISKLSLSCNRLPTALYRNEVAKKNSNQTTNYEIYRCSYLRVNLHTLSREHSFAKSLHDGQQNSKC